jgi:enoyl-CoA hydratase/carnithine racemase
MLRVSGFSLLTIIIHFSDTTIAKRTAELLYNMAQLNQVTIGAVNGVACGGGNEFLVLLDMRFAVKSHPRFGQPEIGLGLVPDGGGSQYLPRSIGCGRAMEYFLTGKDILAEEAERYGWINKAFDNSDTRKLTLMRSSHFSSCTRPLLWGWSSSV